MEEIDMEGIGKMKMTRKAFLAGAAAFAAAPAFAKTPDDIRSVLLHWGLNMWGESLPPVYPSHPELALPGSRSPDWIRGEVRRLKTLGAV